MYTFLQVQTQKYVNCIMRQLYNLCNLMHESEFLYMIVDFLLVIKVFKRNSLSEFLIGGETVLPWYMYTWVFLVFCFALVLFFAVLAIKPRALQMVVKGCASEPHATAHNFYGFQQPFDPSKLIMLGSNSYFWSSLITVNIKK